MASPLAPARAVAPPARTVDQRLAALQRANQIRTSRARVKRLMKEGVLDVADILVNPMPELEGMRILDLIQAAPKIGRVKSLRILRVCRIAHGKTVGGLTPRQRGEITRVLMVGITNYISDEA